MDPSEYYTYEDRAYVSPTLSRDEQLGFVNTLRDTVNNDTARINAQTQALGTDITPNLGGLTGSEGYFAQRYQTTPVESQVNTLKATAQAKALNDLMTNYQNQAANRYNQSYRKARAKALTSSGGTNSNTTGLTITTETNDNGNETPNTQEVDTNPNTSNFVPIGENTYQDKSTGITYSPASTGFMSMSNQGMALGVWPDGAPLTLGSTYSAGGKTYTYQQFDGMAYPSVFVINSNGL